MFVQGGERPQVPATIVGRLLISTPVIGDGDFDHSVVFMLGHDEEGALGVTLNRPMGLAVSEAMSQWADLATTPAEMFSGGPVEGSTVVGVAKSSEGGSGYAVVPGLADCFTIDLDQDSVLAAIHVTKLRIFAGYAGWGARQLESEILAGAWFVVDALEADVFSDEPAGLWERVLRRQPNSSQWFANYPTDLHNN